MTPTTSAPSTPSGAPIALSWRSELPFWLLLACYLPAWLALSYWRSRSKLRRIAASLPESGAAADRFEN